MTELVYFDPFPASKFDSLSCTYRVLVCIVFLDERGRTFFFTRPNISHWQHVYICLPNQEFVYIFLYCVYSTRNCFMNSCFHTSFLSLYLQIVFLEGEKWLLATFAEFLLNNFLASLVKMLMPRLSKELRCVFVSA